MTPKLTNTSSNSHTCAPRVRGVPGGTPRIVGGTPRIVGGTPRKISRVPDSFKNFEIWGASGCRALPGGTPRWKKSKLP